MDESWGIVWNIIFWIVWIAMAFAALGKHSLSLGGAVYLLFALEKPESRHRPSLAAEWNQKFADAIEPYQGGWWFWLPLVSAIIFVMVLLILATGQDFVLPVVVPAGIVTVALLWFSSARLPKRFPFPSDWQAILPAYGASPEDLSLQPYTALRRSWVTILLFSPFLGVGICRLFGLQIQSNGFLLFTDLAATLLLMIGILAPRFPSRNIFLGANFPPFQMALRQEFRTQVEFRAFLVNGQKSIIPDKIVSS